MAYRWTKKFLGALASSLNVSEACRAAGVSRETVYKHRRSDLAFAAAWDDARETAVDDLEGEAYRRALGCERPVYYKGEKCGTVRDYSDALAMFLLKANRRPLYGERVEASIHASGEIRTVIYLPDNGRESGDQAPAGASGSVPGDPG